MADKTWLVLVYHQVIASPGEYDVTPANLDAELNQIKSSGIVVKSIGQSLAELIPQL